MASAMPELIFVAGPQQGERAVIMTATAVIGRSPTAEIHLTEEATSREHVKFQFTHDGWVMENLSANGTLINGKRYKKDKKVLLDTGDVMTVGLETKILYVAPGDDPEEAIQTWRGANPAPEPRQAPPKQPAAAPHPAQPRGQQDPAATSTPPATPSAAGRAQPSPAGKAQHAKKGDQKAVVDLAAEGAAAEALAEKGEKSGKKLKIILLAVVMIGVVVFGLALMFRDDGGQQPTGAPGLTRLTAEQITAALEEPIKMPLSQTQADTALQTAVNSYMSKELWSPGDLYRCVRQFKLYKAYSQAVGFDEVKKERMYNAATQELDDLIRQRYEVAWKFERAQNYRMAKETFESLMREIPPAEVDRGSLIDTVLLKDVKQHIIRANTELGKVR